VTDPQPVTVDLEYRAAIEQEWADDDAYFRTSPGSPLLPEEREGYGGIPHFPIDEGWLLRGLRLEPYSGSAPVNFEMEATRGEPRPAVRAGQLTFTRAGTELRLVVYQFVVEGAPDERLFLPFMDATTGVDTYAAGRYVEVVQDADHSWTLDFNRCYHPSCVYNPRYSCPITPPENRLPIRIEAGVRLDGHSH
jgi:uncharacterized protein (DUF1684 family)